MARSLVLSNGELCVALDRFAEVRDLYYPHVGLEDHVRGHYVHRIGIWVDGEISWLSEDGEWKISVGCEEDAQVSAIEAVHPRLQIELHFSDVVYNERSVFIRRVTVLNKAQASREIRIFFGQQFEISKVHGGDTAYYDPASHSVIHYKGRRVFQISAMLDGELLNDYAIGITNYHGKEGTYRDADDGVLSKNPIEHGPVDSVIGVYGSYEAGQSKVCHYWLVAAQSVALAQQLNEYVTMKTPEYLLQAAREHWKKWVKRAGRDFSGLDASHVALFKHSLMHARSHVDRDGGILASCDSDMLQYGLDTYSYVWPRDAAYIALALDQAGDKNVSKRLFEYCNAILTADGYLMHKYLPDKSLGSSWHPWIRGSQLQLPIQEDETALIIYALHQHYLRNNDLEMVENLYSSLVEKAAHFMVEYRDHETGLPFPSYDLWEEKRGTSTYTASAVYAALQAAADLSLVVGKPKNEALYRKAAEEVREGILKHLWDEKEGVFIKSLNVVEGVMTKDTTLDVSSVYGVSSFGILRLDDPRLERAWEITVRRLSHGISVGGLARYEGDQYFRGDKESAGNPWIITTLWYAEYLIARAKNEADLARAREIFSWVVKHSEFSGVLPEQLDPRSGAPLSATPLTWSHAVYVSVVLKYAERYEEVVAK